MLVCSHGALRVVNTGVKLFEREEAKGCAGIGYRVCQEGLEHVSRWQTRQLVDCEREAAVRILRAAELLSADEIRSH